MAGRFITKGAMALAALACAAVPVQATACTFAVFQENLGEANFRDECRAASRDPGGFVEELVEKDELWHLAEIASAMREGEAGCKKQQEAAFALIDSGLGSPLRLPIDRLTVWAFRDWAPPEFSQERREEVLIGSWISSASYYQAPCDLAERASDTFVRGYSEDTVRQWLLRPHYWQVALEQFGNHPVRDLMVLQELIDPENTKFDRALAGQLAARYYRRRNTAYGQRQNYVRSFRAPPPVKIEIAELLIDPRYGAPDFASARRVLGPYWQYYYADPEKITPQEREHARLIWVRIAQNLLTHRDEKERMLAQRLFGVGGLPSTPSAPIENALPRGAPVTILEKWPEGLAPLRVSGRTIPPIVDRYPSRALRDETVGRVELGIIFKPDGTFHSVHVTSSAGDVLDSTAVRNAQRFLRPRLSEMQLEGFDGQYVYVPLPAFEYTLSLNILEDRPPVPFDGEVIRIYAPPRGPYRNYSGHPN